MKNDLAKIQEFIEAGMNIDTPMNPIGQTPLMYFCLDLNCESAQAMIEWGASLTAVDSIGRTPLHYVVQNDMTGEATEWLLQYGADGVNAMSKAGVTPLMLACKLSHEKCVEQLLNAGANPFLKDQLGQEAKDYKVSIHTQTIDPIATMLNDAKT